MKKCLYLLLLLLLLPLAVHADDSGTCGDNLSYVYEEATGTLTISGTGAMTDHPWKSYSDKIKEVVLNDGVTSIGTNAFYGCSGLTSIEIPNSVTSIGTDAFQNCSGLTSIEIPNSVTSIGVGAFQGCSGMTSIVISNSVTSIRTGAFAFCSGLTAIEIPNSVTSIGDYAFYGCSSLTSINVESGNTKYDSRDNCNAIIEASSNTLIAGCKSTIIPNSVTSIGEAAFGGCSGLTSIEIPNSVTSIGDYAFQNCSGFTSIEIPNSVTSIGSGAFDGCSGMTSIVIPNSVMSIGEITFRDCIGLTSIVIPNSVTSIGDCAFQNCSGFTSIEIPNSVTSIGSGAFYSCSGMTSIVIPNSVTSISNFAFEGCSGLTAISVESGNTKYDSRDNCNAIIEVSSNTLIAGCKNTIIPNSVTSIGDYAFSGCSGLTFLICLAESVPTTDSNAFTDSPISSATLYVPAGSKAAYETADVWKDFKKIVEIDDSGTCGDNVSYVFEEATGTLIISGASAMSDDSSSYPWSSYRDNIKKIVLNGVTSIGSSAFHGCSSLTSVTCRAEIAPTAAPDAFDNSPIGSAMLYVPNGCKAAYETADVWKDFKEIVAVYDSGTCGDNVSYVFEEATGTLIISGTGAITDRPWNSYKLKIKKIVLNYGVTSIGSSAFLNCRGLTSIEIPNSVTSIGPSAFYGCSGLTSIVIPNSVTSIGNYAFQDCRGLTSIEIPNSVTSIGNSAFSGCYGLTSIEIPNSVTSIGNWAFQYCSGLTSIVIPNSVTSIGERAFSGCSGLTSINVESGNTNYDSRDNCNAIIEISSNTLIAGCKNTIIPNSVTSIGNSAFIACSGLTSIEIPNSVTSIGSSAFSGCSGLTSIEIPNSVTSIGSSAFSGCSGLTSIEIPNSVTSIGEGAFSSCSGLTSINVESGNTNYDSRDNCNAIIEISSNTLIAGCKNTIIPNSVTSIGERAFSGCSGLTAIVIPNSVTRIGNYAFYNCSGLTSIVIPNSVTSFGEYAFSGCSGLTYIEIPNSVTSIGNYAFQSCRGLTSIEIPNSVTSIGKFAFSFCSGLTSVTCLAESVPTTDVYAFYNSPISSATLYVPVGSKAAYEAAYYWKDFKEIVEKTDLSLYDNVVYIEDIESTAGHPVTLSLKMNNTIAPTGFQCDVYLPEGVTAAQDGDGFYLMDISTERTTANKTDYSSSALQPDGGLRFMCSSTKSYTFSGSEGEVAYLTVNIDPDLEEGSYPLILRNIEISDANSNAYRVSYVVTTLKILEYTLGDANNDGSIGVSDFTAIANCIMGTPPANFVEKAADVNADGVISVSDLTGEANIILYGSVAPNVSYAKAPYGYDNRYASIGAKDVRALAGEEFTVAVNINGNYEYSGYQFDMNIPEGMNVLNVSREKKGSDLFMSRMTDDNTLRVLSASPTGEVSENTVVYVTLATKQEGLYSLDINNAIVSADAVTYSMDKSSFMVGIDKGTTGIATVDGMTDGNNGVAYDLTGKKVKYDGNAASLKKGIYIINGKKVSK